MDIYIVQVGDTIDIIAEKYGASVERLIQDNDITNPDSLVPGQTIVIAYPEITYMVREGDSLESIASAYGVTILQLLRNNPFLSNREYIYPGETLVISYKTKGKTTTMGYAYPYIAEDTLKKTLPYLTYISVFNYRTIEGGEIITFEDDAEIIQRAKEYEVVPLMLIASFTERGESNIGVAYDLLNDEEYQERNINSLMDIIKSKGYYGANIAFSFLNTTNESLYQRYITKVSDRFNAEGYLLFITFNTNISNVDNEVVFEKVDYSSISQVDNKTVFLEFIWGTNYGPPAPVTSIGNLRQFTDYALTMISPDKILLGVPVIGYDWALPYVSGKSSANSLTLQSSLNLALDVGAPIEFDEVSQTPYFLYFQEAANISVQHIVWFINSQTIDSLVSLVSENGLSGSGVWNIMVYFAQLWLVINSQYEIIKVLSEI